MSLRLTFAEESWAHCYSETQSVGLSGDVKISDRDLLVDTYNDRVTNYHRISHIDYCYADVGDWQEGHILNFQAKLSANFNDKWVDQLDMSVFGYSKEALVELGIPHKCSTQWVVPADDIIHEANILYDPNEKT